jgi:hypothetical protein
MGYNENPHYVCLRDLIRGAAVGVCWRKRHVNQIGRGQAKNDEVAAESSLRMKSLPPHDQHDLGCSAPEILVEGEISGHITINRPRWGGVMKRIGVFMRRDGRVSIRA